MKLKFLNAKSTVGGDALVLTISRILVSLIGLITSMLLARFRSLEEYGTYAQIIMATDLVSSILLLGLPNSVNYFLAQAETQEKKQKFLSIYLTLSTMLTVIIGVCLFFATPLIIRYYDNPAISTFAYVFAVYPWSMLMINSLSNVCVIYQKANRLIYFNIAQSLLTLFLLLAAKIFGWSFRVYMALNMIEIALLATFAVFWMRKMAGKIRISLDRAWILKIFRFSIPVGLASVVGTLNVELDKWVIGKFFSTEEFAIYANASKELPLTMLATSLTAVLLPLMVRLLKNGQTDEAVRKWGCAIRLSLCLMALFVGGLFTFAPDVMSLFYSQKYVTADSVTVFRIYSLILLFRCTYWGIILNAKGKTNFILISSILTLLCNLGGNIGFCYLLGFTGPAYSSLICTAVMNIVQLLFTCRVSGVRLRHIFPWKGIVFLLCQTVGFSAVFYVIRYVFIGELGEGASIAVSVGLGCVWAILYLGINFKYLYRNWKKLNEAEPNRAAQPIPAPTEEAP